MDHEFSRQRLVTGAMAASCAAPQPGAVLGQVASPARKTLDIHVHLLGIGDNGSSCRLLGLPRGLYLRPAHPAACARLHAGRAPRRGGDTARPLRQVSIQLAGLTFGDCEPIRGVDEAERPIRWKNAQLDNQLRQPLRLEMKFSGANVYGLRADWQWLDAQGLYMLEDGKLIDRLLDL